MAVSLPLVEAPAIKGRLDSVYVATLSENLTLSGSIAANVVKLDPSGSARDVTLPDVAAYKGVCYRVINAADAAENLVIKNAGGSTIATANQNEQAEVYSDGTDWILVAITTIALS